MVTFELNFIGKVKIQGSRVVHGPDYLNPTINILLQKYGSSSAGDLDYRVAENLVEMIGGRILEHETEDGPPKNAC